MLDRRLATVMLADIVGYSRLMHADEEGTLAVVMRLRQEVVEVQIARHGGRLVKTIGDAFLVEHASPVQATRCALALRDGAAAQGLQLRIGLHLGDVIAEDGDLLGDAVNVAARLQAAAAPGEISLSAIVAEQLRGKLKVPLVDRGAQRVKNIDTPVRMLVVPVEDAPTPRWRPGRGQLAAGALTLVLLLAAVAGWHWWPIPPAAPDGGAPVVAVLPFENLSGDPANDYFSDGVTADIIAALGLYRDLAVLSRNAVFPYRDAPDALARLRSELGARYAVEGGVRRTADRVRVTAQLVDIGTGHVLRSEQSDVPVADILAVEDQVVRSIAGALAAGLNRAEQTRATALSDVDLDAYDRVLRARALMARTTRADNRAARELLEQVVAENPDHVAALVALAEAINAQSNFGWTEFPGRGQARAEVLASRAIALDDTSWQAHGLLGRLLANRGDYQRARVEVERALSLNPSDAESLYSLGAVLLWSGDAQGAVRQLERALRRDPAHSPAPLIFLALAHLVARQLAQAVDTAELASVRFPEDPYLPAILAAAYGQLGREEQAQRAAARVREVSPFFDPDAFASRLGDADRAYVREGLRKAGFADPGAVEGMPKA